MCDWKGPSRKPSVENEKWTQKRLNKSCHQIGKTRFESITKSRIKHVSWNTFWESWYQKHRTWHILNSILIKLIIYYTLFYLTYFSLKIILTKKILPRYINKNCFHHIQVFHTCNYLSLGSLRHYKKKIV